MSHHKKLPYGRCPECGAPGRTRERRMNGNDGCVNYHTYPSSTAITEPAEQIELSLEQKLNRLCEDYRIYLMSTEHALRDAIKIRTTQEEIAHAAMRVEFNGYDELIERLEDESGN